MFQAKLLLLGLEPIDKFMQVYFFIIGCDTNGLYSRWAYIPSSNDNVISSRIVGRWMVSSLDHYVLSDGVLATANDPITE
jgi:hypothetical protein